jgi:hypothetical protein
MRKLSFFAAASIFAAPLLAHAMPLNDSLFDKGTEGKLMRGDDATHLVFPDFNMKINLIMQDTFRYSDLDEVEGRDVDDSTSFEVNLLRLKLEGDLLDKEWSYYFQNDFVQGEEADGSNGSELKDAWMQWNADDAAKLRAGQFKVPYSRQELDSDEKLAVMFRGLASDSFALGRNQGVLLHGPIDDAIGYAIGVYNGESDGEGQNLPGVDNKVSGSAALTANIGEYGSRTEESDFRENKDFAMTMGAAAVYGQGTSDVLLGSTDFDKVDANADIGLRVEGFTTQAEFYFRKVELDDVDTAEDSAEDMGFYVQAGYQFVPNEWELVAQFDYVSPDSDLDSVSRPFADSFLPEGIDDGTIDDVQQYAVVLNYYINGHALKVQTGVTWTVTNFDTDFDDGEGDITDAFYQMKLAGYL